MVGWNVVVTYLVVGQHNYKINIYFYSCLLAFAYVFLLMNYDEHDECLEWMNALLMLCIDAYAYIIMFNTWIACMDDFLSLYNCRHKLGNNTYLNNNLFCNQLRHYNVPPNHRPTCSSISQQRYHPRAGHDSLRNKELIGLHIAKDNNTTRVHSSTKPT